MVERSAFEYFLPRLFPSLGLFLSLSRLAIGAESLRFQYTLEEREIAHARERERERQSRDTQRQLSGRLSEFSFLRVSQSRLVHDPRSRPMSSFLICRSRLRNGENTRAFAWFSVVQIVRNQGIALSVAHDGPQSANVIVCRRRLRFSLAFGSPTANLLSSVQHSSVPAFLLVESIEDELWFLKNGLHPSVAESTSPTPYT